MKTFLTERIEETLSGYTASVVVNIYGNELDTLDSQARELEQALTSVRGATEVQVQSPPGTPQIGIRQRKDDVARWGFDPLDVLDAIQTAYGGDTVGQVYDGNRVFDVSVVFSPGERRSMEQIGDLPLRSSEGNYVPLRQLADIYESSGRYIVLHQGVRRVQTITCNVAGRNVESFVDEAKQRVGKISLPAGSYVEFTGTAAAQAQSRRDLLVHSLLAGLGIILLLSVVMETYRNLLLIRQSPFRSAWRRVRRYLAGGVLSIGSLVGFVILFGITLRNSIMMISHYEHLVTVEGGPWGWDTAIRGAIERLIPILMTATVTGLALLPLALGSGDPGREIEGPMDIVILGGLFKLHHAKSADSSDIGVKVREIYRSFLMTKDCQALRSHPVTF